MPTSDNNMNTPDISPCRTPQDIRDALFVAMAGKTVVANRCGAIRWFRKAGIPGKVRSRTILDEKREFRGLFGRVVFVRARIEEYFIDPKSGDCVYTCETIVY